ncbi:hypothetical protein, partial [Waltera sp.]|uniref:hypothetical protein n=1 Tax=Waltera sp. TaxID=2815806 RepID=UPI003AEF6B88
GNVLKQAILGTDGECLESSTRYDLKDRATHRTNPAGGVTVISMTGMTGCGKRSVPTATSRKTMTGRGYPTPMTAAATASAPPMH